MARRPKVTRVTVGHGTPARTPREMIYLNSCEVMVMRQKLALHHYRWVLHRSRIEKIGLKFQTENANWSAARVSKFCLQVLSRTALGSYIIAGP